MKVFSRIKRSMRKSIMVGALTAVAIGAGLLTTNTAHAATSSGYNCDDNAVVYCGASSPSVLISKYKNGDTKNSAASIQHIYDWFGISSSDISSMTSASSEGYVTKTGDVYLNGKEVATGALTAGRQNIAGSTPRNYGGTPFYSRPPSVSFLDSSLNAMVDMKDGVFQFAILNSCGNPVEATPTTTPKPAYTINKKVKAANASTYAKSITVDSDTNVDYQVVVDSNGNAPVTGLKVSDKLPTNVTYTAGTLKLNGAAVSAADASAFFNGGYTVGTLDNGKTDTFTFEATVAPNETVETCTAATFVNTGSMRATGLSGQSSTASVNQQCLPKPVYACSSLTATPNSRDEYTFTAKATAENGATITGYDLNFGDGNTLNVPTAATSTEAIHTYTSPGTYSASVTVNVEVNGQVVSVHPSSACETSVTIKPAPAAECTGLTIDQNTTNPQEITATATDTTSGGATLTNASFDWGDGSTPTSGTSLTADHTYAANNADTTYTVTATLTFSNGIAASNCEAQVSVNTIVPVCNDLDVSVNSDDRTVVVNSLDTTPTDYSYATVDWGDGTPVASQTDLTGESHTYSGTNNTYTITAVAYFNANGTTTSYANAQCEYQVNFTSTPPVVPPVTPPTVPPTTPTALVNTGPGDVIGIFVAITLIGAIAHRLYLSRRLSRDS